MSTAEKHAASTPPPWPPSEDGAATCVKPPTPLDDERAELWRQVEALTAQARQGRADELARAGVRHLALQRLEWEQWERGELEEKPPRPEPVKVELNGREFEVSKWHAARHSGAVGKYKRIDTCGQGDGYLKMTCGSCDEEHYMRLGCGHRECPRCRHLHANRTKRYVENARRALRDAAKKQCVSYKLRERMLTLTVPHYEWRPGQPAAEFRIRVLYAAWDIFRDWLREYQLQRTPEGAEDLVHFFRVWEWTEGEDGDGHPHFHVYVHGPFLPQDEIKKAWARALKCASGEDIEEVIVDIRAATDKGNVKGKDGRKRRLVDELVKYMLKDYSMFSRDKFVNPAVLARVLNEMMRRRQRQTSRGFSAWSEMARERLEQKHCTCCGVVGELEVIHHPHTLKRFEVERGPPCNRAPRVAHKIMRPALPAIPAQQRFQI